MRERCGFDYAVVRVVPRVEREEFINAGVVLHAPTQRFLASRVVLDAHRLLALDADADADAIARQLAAFSAVCAGDAAAGPIARLPVSERFHWLVAPRSTIVQTSAVHAGLCEEPSAALERLFAALVARPRGRR